jgi:dethiobiotin synthetase
MSVPYRIVAVSGTGTGVGKTWTCVRLITALRARGLSVAARKPAQSFDVGDAGRTDAELLAQATGEAPMTVCPAHRWYPVAMAPPMAAAALGSDPFGVDDLAAELSASWSRADVGVVELAGGPYSPIATDGDSADLARLVRPAVDVLVADAGLGVINAVRSSLTAFAAERIVIMLNRYDEGDQLHVANRTWLESRLTAPVATTIDELAALLATPAG